MMITFYASLPQYLLFLYATLILHTEIIISLVSGERYICGMGYLFLKTEILNSFLRRTIPLDVFSCFLLGGLCLGFSY